MKIYRSEAIVLRTRKLGESDKIITIFTKEYGIRNAVAKGVRKTTSKIGARVEPFNCIDVQIYEGRSLDNITQVEIIDAFSKNISKSFESFTTANLISELCEKLIEEKEQALSLYSLLKGALYALSYKDYVPVMVANSFCFRALAISGWAPSCYKCAVCSKDGLHEYFNVHSGGAMCFECREQGCVKVDVYTMKVLSDLLVGNWNNLYNVPGEVIDEVTDIVNSYTQWHLERRLKSVQFQGMR
ncbi:DNA repair protein RecO [Actinomyces sp. zg-332]|uniref:DNA repair protein RecO n=1 Tax=Actinomyces sp. zg-332 TaxID=2708340 RepID=UPI0014229967|nr:DNA repair protein RecO [Actinomyces sp. zg-332]QPK94490.1 DNA repair protein RecO [Actinomyces sp. zg-332]